MQIGNNIKYFLGYVGGVVISCGPSQAYGLIKGAIDAARLAVIQAKIFYYGYMQKECQSSYFHTTTKELSGKISDEKGVQKGLEDVATIQLRHNQELRTLKVRAIKADALALIPFVGAIFSWRVYQKDSSLDPFRVFESATEQILEDYTQLTAKALFYPGAMPGVLRERSNNLSYKISIPVFDPHVQGGKRELRAYHIKHDDASVRPTVVIFHGNAMTSEDMLKLGQYYYYLGYDALMPTMGGYPGSPGISTTEESSYRDVEAIKLYLQNMGVTGVGYHGLSIGGSLAFQGAVGETAATKLQTKFVVADQTFTAAEHTAENVVANGPGAAICPFARGAARACFPQYRVDLGRGVATRCDGLNNEEKTKRMRDRNIPLFVVKASKDHIMAIKIEDEKGEHYEQNLGDRLLKARYEDHNLNNSITLSGGHSSSLLRDLPACRTLREFTAQAMPVTEQTRRS